MAAQPFCSSWPVPQAKTFGRASELRHSALAALCTRLVDRQLHLCTEALRPFWTGAVRCYHCGVPHAQPLLALEISKWTPLQTPTGVTLECILTCLSSILIPHWLAGKRVSSRLGGRTVGPVARTVRPFREIPTRSYPFPSNPIPHTIDRDRQQQQ